MKHFKSIILHYMQIGEVGQFGRPVITLIVDGDVVNLVFGVQNIIVFQKLLRKFRFHIPYQRDT